MEKFAELGEFWLKIGDLKLTWKIVTWNVQKETFSTSTFIFQFKLYFPTSAPNPQTYSFQFHSELSYFFSHLKFSNFSFFPTALHELHVSHKTELIAIETIKYSFFFKYDNFPVHLMCDPGKSCTLIRNSKKSIPDESECFASFIVLSILTLVEIQTNFEQVLVSKSS